MQPHIILVDDDNLNLRVGCRILNKHGMNTTALLSGELLLEHIKGNGFPDLILLDVNMPDMDGFQTLEALRKAESGMKKEQTPVIFLTSDEESETERQGFEMGISDYIRKPFIPEVLVKRIDNIISNLEQVHSLKTEATTDKLTGFFNKAAAGAELSECCSHKTGCLMMIDLDSFKLVNDIYGHEAGDKILITFSEILKEELPEGSICARVGGDEFTAFSVGTQRERDVKYITSQLNEKLTASAKKILGDDMNIPLGVSVGAITVPKYGNDYDSLLKLADKALYIVKQNGKHGCQMFDEDEITDEKNKHEEDIRTISMILGERTIPNTALQLDRESFAPVYRYMMRYLIRNHLLACQVLFTLSPNEKTSDEEYKLLRDDFGVHIRENLRKSDVFMRNAPDRYFVVLMDVKEEAVDELLDKILNQWYKKKDDSLVISYSTELAGNI